MGNNKEAWIELYTIPANQPVALGAHEDGYL